MSLPVLPSRAQLACLRLEAPPASAPAAAALGTVLQKFSPWVAPLPEHPHVYFLDASGLVGLYPHHTAWAQALLLALVPHGAVARLAVGYSRFATFVLAHTVAPTPLRVAASAQAELAAVHALPLAAAPLNQKDVHLAQELGLRTLGCLLRLPEGEVAQALGPAATALHRLAQQPNRMPAVPLPLPEPCQVEAVLEPPDADSHRLLFVGKTLLPALVAQAQARMAVLGAIDVTLVQEAPCTLKRRPPEHSTRRLEAARPGRQEAPWLDLLRLALEDWPMPRAVQTVRLTAELRAPPRQQLQLWPSAGAARNESHTTAAISQLRARFGDSAVTCAELVDAHRPEAQYRYRPAHKLATLAPALTSTTQRRAQLVEAAQATGAQPLMRRLLPTAQPLPARLVRQLREALAHAASAAEVPADLGPSGPIPHLRAVPSWRPEAMGPRATGGSLQTRSLGSLPRGPYRLSQGWWQEPCDRDYYYLPQEDGGWLWVFFDRQARAWRLQGWVD